MTSANMNHMNAHGGKIVVKHTEWLKKAWELFQADMGDFLQLGFFAWLFILPCGIPYFFLAGPLTVGLLYYARQKVRHEQTEVSDLFIGFKHYLVNSLIIYFVVIVLSLVIGGVINFFLNFIPILGFLLWLALEVVFAGVCVIFIYFSMSTLLGGRHDSMGCLDKTLEIYKQDPVQLTLFGILIAVINILGLAVCTLGVIATLPLTALMMVIAYESIIQQMTGQGYIFEGEVSPPSDKTAPPEDVE